MAWYEKASVHWPWLVRKEINIVQFNKHGSDNKFGAKLTFKLLGFQVGVESLLVVNQSEPGWGVFWDEYPKGSEPGNRCITYRVQVERAIQHWFEYVDKIKKYQQEARARELDRGTVVSKYKAGATPATKPSPNGTV